MACDYRKALDLVRDGRWDDSHKVVQPYTDELACLIHAYLHRVEGDFENANHWYQKIGIEAPTDSLGEELRRLYRLSNAVEPTG